MDLRPSSEQQALIDRARRLALERFAPRAAVHDREATFPFDDYADLRAEGLLALCVPARYGGLGASYETYCLVCHGPGGRGDGPISAANGRTPPGPFPGIGDLLGPTAMGRSDGYIFGVVTYAQAMGRGLMPRYGDKVRGTDRWDVVNYVRHLQAQGAGGGQ